MCVYDQILIYIVVELYKNNNTGLTKHNVLEKRNGNCIEKNENKHQGFFYFLHHFGPCIAGMYCICMWYDIIYVLY